MNWLQKLVNGNPPTVPSTPVVQPDWLKKTLQLPPWAKVAVARSDKVCLQIDVDTAAAMREWLPQIGAPEQLTQYWIESAYQCIKLDVQSAIDGTEFDPRHAGAPAEFVFARAPEFALANFPMGEQQDVQINGVSTRLRGIELATRGRHAREHYKRIRGRLPF